MMKAKLTIFFLAIIFLIPFSQAFAQVQEHVPAPPSLLLLGSGLVGLAGWRWFKKS